MTIKIPMWLMRFVLGILVVLVVQYVLLYVTHQYGHLFGLPTPMCGFSCANTIDDLLMSWSTWRWAIGTGLVCSIGPVIWRKMRSK